MKKLLLIFSLIFACFAMQAQESTTQDYTIPYTDSYFVASFNTNATTATDSLWYYTVLAKTKMPIKYDFKVRLDSISGTKQITPVVLKGKKFLSDNWTTITTVNWTNGSDTTILFNQTTTSQYYKWYQVYIKSNLKGFVFKVTDLAGNIWEQ